MAEGEEFYVFDHAEDLAKAPALVLGDRVFIRETGELFHCAGNTTPAIATRLGWKQEMFGYLSTQNSVWRQSTRVL